MCMEVILCVYEHTLCMHQCICTPHTLQCNGMISYSGAPYSTEASTFSQADDNWDKLISGAVDAQLAVQVAPPAPEAA